MRWFKPWAVCVGFYYPALWLSVSCLFATPALLRSTLSGEHLEFVRLTAFGMIAVCTPVQYNTGARVAHFWFTSASALWTLVPLVATVSATLAVAGRKRRLLSGLMISVLASFALVLPTMLLREIQTVNFVFGPPLVFCFALLCFGLWWMSTGWPIKGYWNRIAGLYTGLVLLPLPLGIAFRPFHGYLFWNLAWRVMVPSAVAVLLVSSWGPKTQNSLDPGLGSWTQVTVGFGVTALLAAGATWGGPTLARAFEQHRLTTNREVVASLPPIPVDTSYPKVFFQKGVSFSAEFPDPYASAGARQMLRALRKYGVNAVALVPYAWMRLGSPEVHELGPNSWESDEGLRELSRLAHAIGIKVMLKPGIWVRGEHFAGDIAFSSQADRQGWFDQYGRFIDRYARLAAEIHADIYCVGGEFVHMSPDARDWRRIIASVRQIYPGPVTYAANFGGEFENLQFWDALDYIGLQEYYPLPSDLSTKELVRKVEAVQKQFKKPVLFTEVGFPSVAAANRDPWSNGRSGKIDLRLQARCYDAIFHAFYDKPWFAGMYWWKVGTNGFGGANDPSLTPWNKPAMKVLKKWYTGSRN